MGLADPEAFAHDHVRRGLARALDSINAVLPMPLIGEEFIRATAGVRLELLAEPLAPAHDARRSCSALLHASLSDCHQDRCNHAGRPRSHTIVDTSMQPEARDRSRPMRRLLDQCRELPGASRHKHASIEAATILCAGSARSASVVAVASSLCAMREQLQARHQELCAHAYNRCARPGLIRDITSRAQKAALMRSRAIALDRMRTLARRVLEQLQRPARSPQRLLDRTRREVECIGKGKAAPTLRAQRASSRR